MVANLEMATYKFPLLILTIFLTISLQYNEAYSPAVVTWYGDPNGAGSTGGACGYGKVVENQPFYSMIAAGGPSLFKNGKGCGTCYEIVCKSHAACSGSPIRVVITDECPGGPCAAGDHFDLSGTAFGALAKPGQADQLRNAGTFSVEYSRVACDYKGTNIAFRMDPGANPYYMSFVVEYEEGDGNLAAVEIQPTGGDYVGMEEMRSAVWKLNSGGPLKGPFNVRLTSEESRKVVVAQSVIPADWKPDKTYRSVVNF